MSIICAIYKKPFYKYYFDLKYNLTTNIDPKTKGIYDILFGPSCDCNLYIVSKTLGVLGNFNVCVGLNLRNV